MILQVHCEMCLHFLLAQSVGRHVVTHLYLCALLHSISFSSTKCARNITDIQYMFEMLLYSANGHQNVSTISASFGLSCNDEYFAWAYHFLGPFSLCLFWFSLVCSFQFVLFFVFLVDSNVYSLKEFLSSYFSGRILLRFTSVYCRIWTIYIQKWYSNALWASSSKRNN